MTKERKKDLFVFFVGLMAVFKIRIFGTFYGSEILAYMSYLFIDWTKYRQNRKVVTLIKMAFVWLVGVILSDVYNSTPTVDALKGAFNVIFLIMLIPFVYWMIKDKPSRLLYYAWGYGIARILLFHYGGGLEAARESLADMAIWRVYFYFAVAIAVAGWLYYIGKHIYAYILMMAFAVWSLSCVSRNIFLSMSVAVAVLYYIDRISLASPVDTMRIFRKKILGLFLTLGVALLCVNYTYEYKGISYAHWCTIPDNSCRQSFAKAQRNNDPSIKGETTYFSALQSLTLTMSIDPSAPSFHKVAKKQPSFFAKQISKNLVKALKSEYELSYAGAF